MEKIILAFVLTLAIGIAHGQTDKDRAASAPIYSPEKREVISTIQRLFDGMRAGDSSMVNSAFLPEATMHTAFFNQSSQKSEIRGGSLERFLGAVGTPHDDIWDEKIWAYSVQIDGPLATVWTPYTFYLGEKMSHCGINTFLMFRNEEGWKIMAIADTRRTTDCQTEMGTDAETIHTMLDAWHLAAATADEDVFFGSMTEDGIYLGTDASERWQRDELKKWSEKYFAKESAWSFKATKRHVYFSDDQHTAWFEEELDTWMGACRGSGVVQKFADGWKIKHYNLAVTVPNEVIDGFIELVKNTPGK